MEQLPKDHPLRKKIAAAEERAKEQAAEAKKTLAREARIHKGGKQGVALKGKI